MTLADLRKRAPELKKKIAAVQKELQNLNVRAVEDTRWIELGNSMERFLARLNQSAEILDNSERQKVLRLIVKQITVGTETITIHHSIPVGTGSATENPPSYPLCTRGPMFSMRHWRPSRGLTTITATITISSGN